MKYKIFTLLLFTLLLVAACQQQEKVTPQTEEQTSKATITIEPPRE